jgi:hypothetical protein
MAYEKSRASDFLANNTDARQAVANSKLADRLRKNLQTVDIDGETFFIAEGDTLLDEDELGIYAFQRETEDEARRASQVASEAGLGVTPLAAPPRGLVGMTQNGKIVRWAPGIALTYRVAKQTFTSNERYQLTVEAVERATKDWENTCGVKFEYRSDLDGQPGPGPAGALFSVREINAGGSFIAAAFFPNDPPARRRVLIDPSFFAEDLGFDRVGVLRHELGHVLGFRHEHIRSGAPPVCPDEPLGNTIDLTKYDPQSVMHYFCGGVGSRSLRITDSDRTGAQRVYGPPLDGTEFVGV